MSPYKLALTILLMVALIAGCSKKKEEAAEMEQELLGQKDTAAQVQTEVGPVADTGPEVDVTAIPEEQPIYAPPPGEGYTVQVAGCEDRAYAQFLIDRYTSRGYEPFITTATVGGQTYYRVRIGTFETLAEANALKAELADRYSVKAWIDYTQ
ncbi:MAG: SPOR domain-containing protein [Candidatus Zixiibacteriota bacterium]|nr:MAG: SPOR domain-containing protein [candidate division Zixibacteria bacterium]